MPVRIAHGWAIAWLDFYQTPAIVTEGAFSEVKGFFKELTRPKEIDSLMRCDGTWIFTYIYYEQTACSAIV
ncbi:unnamed protein product [Durusdinium trenchii]|uniref:Uncharacterized protein n=1 Tax=Durusdinium trenchii TaxID=1381693 RepID=A0ABP0P6X2_9DINO